MSPCLAGWLGHALGERLERVGEADGPNWSAERRRLLARWLEDEAKDVRARRVLPALHAIERVGCVEAIVPVYKLTHHADELVREAASRCWGVLKERGERVRQASELLRAGAAPSTPSLCLLRTAAPARPDGRGDLLRADRTDETARC